jgi:hypothetical protein
MYTEMLMKKKLFAILLALSLLLSLTMAVSAQGNGNSPKQLVDSGWTCFNVPGLGVHCYAPGKNFGDPTIPVLYFDTSDPYASEASFLGTEMLIRADLYKGQPCPQEGLDNYFDIGGYFACHRR